MSDVVVEAKPASPWRPERIPCAGALPQAFIHPQAICESDRIGGGTRIWAFAHVMPGAAVGSECNIGSHCFIESGANVGDRVTIKNGVMVWEGVRIGDDCFVGPGVLFTNDRHPRSPRMPEAADRYSQKGNWLLKTTVGRGASIGAGAILLPGISIGAYASVGAGAVVTDGVAAHRIVVGHPARPVGWACICGLPLRDTLQCSDCAQQYEFRGHQLSLAGSSASGTPAPSNRSTPLRPPLVRGEGGCL